jgi:integrase
MQRAQRAWETDTLRKREAAGAEFAKWAARLGPEWGAEWEGITPELIVGYLEGHWVPSHATREIEWGFHGPAAATLETHVAHLRACFRLRGRVCAWGTGPLASCNPCDSEAVSRYVAGYKRQCAQAGHESVAAKPFGSDKAAALVEWLEGRAVEAGVGVRRVLLRRDICMLCFMHECGKRGSDCGQLRWRDLLGEDGRPVQPADWVPQEGQRVTCKMFSKTHKVQREAAWTFEYCSGEGRALNFLWQLREYCSAREEAGCGWGSGWLFSPQAKNRVGVADAPYGSSAFAHRLRSHLEEAGLDEGETAHGLRRGRTQALVDSGLEAAEVMQVMGMRSAKTYALYSDRSRPTRGKRARH